MSNDIVDFRQLHAGIMKELDRAPQREQAPQPPAQLGHTAERSGPTDKINSYLTRIEQAAAVLQQQRNYMRELEEAVGTLQNQQAELEAALGEDFGEQKPQTRGSTPWLSESAQGELRRQRRRPES